MGNRRKLLYKGGVLFDALTGDMLRSWKPTHEQIIPHEFTVKWQTREGRTYTIREDTTGVCLMVEGTQTWLAENTISLPDFKGEEGGPFGNSHAHVLRVLLHEVLVNIVDGKPMANFMVRNAPSYRDAAIICEALRRTGNLGLVKDWILGLAEPFDLTRAGEPEPDKLGQVLFMLSMVADKEHPLVARVLEQAESFRNTNFVQGHTDGAEHPVYQTKWLKFGLKCLGLPDTWRIPVSYDNYASVFWFDFRDWATAGPAFTEKVKAAAPHLAWAEAHFHGWDPPMPLPAKTYPLSWEQHGEKETPYGMSLVDPQFVDRRISAPHARHAAEMLLYFLDQAAPNRDTRDTHHLHAH